MKSNLRHAIVACANGLVNIAIVFASLMVMGCAAMLVMTWLQRFDALSMLPTINTGETAAKLLIAAIIFAVLLYAKSFQKPVNSVQLSA